MVTKDKVIEVLKTVKDPEIHIDIYTLGLIYNIEADKDSVKILMTLTTPQCPYGPQLMDDLKQALKKKARAKNVELSLTFNPPWKPSDELRKMLGV
ncbi:MAG: metal-sulfur cluster assembly factor [Nanoarchaeota archaeon]